MLGSIPTVTVPPPGNPRDKVRPSGLGVENFASSLVPAVVAGDNLGAKGIMGRKFRGSTWRTI